MARVLKRSNPLFLTEYRNRIKSFHKDGRLSRAFDTWIVYRNGGGHTNILKMTNATGEDKLYYQRLLKGTGDRYTKKR